MFCWRTFKVRHRISQMKSAVCNLSDFCFSVVYLIKHISAFEGFWGWKTYYKSASLQDVLVTDVIFQTLLYTQNPCSMRASHTWGQWCACGRNEVIAKNNKVKTIALDGMLPAARHSWFMLSAQPTRDHPHVSLSLEETSVLPHERPTECNLLQPVVVLQLRRFCCFHVTYLSAATLV